MPLMEQFLLKKTTKSWLLKNDTFFNSSVFTFDMPMSRAIDIDYLHDFHYAETLFKKKY